MTLAIKAGICVAETRMVPLQGENAVAVRRFDRVAGRRVHAISAGTALRAAVDTWQDHFRACGVTHSDLDDLATRIDGEELATQRRSFSPTAYRHPVPRPRRRPF